MNESLEFTLNGEPVALDTDPDRTLLWVLRSDLTLTGTKYGCGEGYCGACTVLVDGGLERACLLTVGDVVGRSVTTIEGVADGDTLHPVQEAFVEHGALQCGFCTPGMIVSAVGLLEQNDDPGKEDIVDWMNENYCRCGAHKRIVSAVQTAASSMRQGGTGR